MSEFALIARHFSRHQSDIALGVGDDCAVFDVLTGHQLVTCIDTLIINRHFPENTPPHAIGYKSVAVNLSDLAAMGATAHSITLALSLPVADDAWVASFAQGIYDCCDEYQVKLIGGDTTCSPTLTISVNAFGFVPKNQAIRRSGANIGDLICVSGEIGSAAYALQHPSSSLIKTLNYPKPQLSLGQALRGFASSMIDISDGLAQDLGHILKASQVSADVYLEQIPLATPLQKLPSQNAYHYALTGGDDYQLLFSISLENYQKFQASYPEFQLYPIGNITRSQDQHKVICYDEGKLYQSDTRGFNHF